MERRNGGAVFGNERGGSQRVLLLVLVLLLLGVGYVYFFTGIIRPQEQPKPPVQTAVKKPLPPRPADNGAAAPAPTPAPTPAKPAETKPAAAPAKPEQKPAPAAAKPAPSPAPAKPAPAAAKPAPAPAKPAQPQAAAKPAPAQPAPAPAKTAKPEKPAAAAKPGAVAATGEKKAPATKGNYTLLIGSYAVPQALKAEEAKLKKAGLKPVAKPSGKKTTQMNRLFLAEYADKGEADAQLGKLKQFTPDAFILPHGGKYQVYAGSYYQDAKAAQEQDRLLDKGFKLLMRKAEAPVKMTRLTAGKFGSKEEAAKEAARLKKLGIPATVIGGK